MSYRVRYADQLTCGQHIPYLVYIKPLTKTTREPGRDAPIATRFGKSNFFSWLPPKDSNPDMLIQSYVNQGGRFRILSLS